MELEQNWKQIRAAFEAGVKSSLHCAIATVTPDGAPHVTPIGFIFLRDDYTAYYFEEYTTKMRHNLERNPRVCLLTVDSRRSFWLRSLYKGRFDSPPGVRLLGIAGERRLATEQERAAYLARVRALKPLRGFELLWRDLRYIREIRLEGFEPVVYPRMTDELWR